MSDEYRWIFIPVSKETEGFKDIPLLYPKRNVARQFQIEHLWLNPKPLRKAVGVKKLEENIEEKIRGYVS